MLTVRKQTTAFGMLLLVALPLLFSTVIFIKQQLLQHQRSQRFETEVLETVTINAEKVNWVKPGKEIQIGNKLFDVKSYKTAGSNIIFTGFYDSKEDKLVKHIDDVEKQKNKTGSPLDKLAIKFLTLPSYKENLEFSIQNHWRVITSRFPQYTESIPGIAYPAEVPPPKYC
jgi:hypothetical protein